MNSTLARVLRENRMPPHEPSDDFYLSFLEIAQDQGVLPLVDYSLRASESKSSFPSWVREELASGASASVTRQLLRKIELERVLAGLAGLGVSVLLMKGFPLSYLIYPEPHLRPSEDIDILIRQEDAGKVRAFMDGRGYVFPNALSGDFVSHQFTCRKDDQDGASHLFDFHWKISNPELFSNALKFEEASATAIPVPDLGSHAKTLSFEHALFLALVHRVAHHHNDERLVWLYDVHLFAEKMSGAQVARFISFAARKRMSAVCRQGLLLGRKFFGTVFSEAWSEILAGPGADEPSSLYLKKGNPRLRDLVLNFRSLPDPKAKVQFVLEVGFPPPDYMMKKYGVSNRMALPWLYARRGFEGALKVFSRRGKQSC